MKKKLSTDITLPKGTEFNIDTVEFSIDKARVDESILNSKYSALIEYGVEKGRKTNRRRVPGYKNRHALSVRYGLDSSELFVSGSPYAFLAGQNVYTSSDLKKTCVAALRKLKSKIGLRPINEDVSRNWVSGEIDLYRVDISVNFRFDSEEQVLRVLTQLRRQLAETRGSMNKIGTTVYWSPQHGKRYQILAYAKGPQMALADGKDKSVMSEEYERLIDDCSNILRIEVRLRRSELAELNLDKAWKWKKNTAQEVFMRYFKRLKILNVLSGRLDEAELASVPNNLRPVLALLKLGANLDGVYKPRTLGNYRSQFKKLGIDIRTPWRKEKAFPLLTLLQKKRYVASSPDWLKKPNLKKRIG